MQDYNNNINLPDINKSEIKNKIKNLSIEISFPNLNSKTYEFSSNIPKIAESKYKYELVINFSKNIKKMNYLKIIQLDLESKHFECIKLIILL